MSPRKLNRVNAEKIKQFSERGSEGHHEQLQQYEEHGGHLPLRKKNFSAAGGRKSKDHYTK